MEAECRGHNESNNDFLSLFKNVNISGNKQVQEVLSYFQQTKISFSKLLTMVSLFSFEILV